MGGYLTWEEALAQEQAKGDESSFLTEVGATVDDFVTHGLSEVSMFWTPDEIRRAFLPDEAAAWIKEMKGQSDADSWYRSIARGAGMGAGFALAAAGSGGGAIGVKLGAKAALAKTFGKGWASKTVAGQAAKKAAKNAAEENIKRGVLGSLRAGAKYTPLAQTLRGTHAVGGKLAKGIFGSKPYQKWAGTVPAPGNLFEPGVPTWLSKVTGGATTLGGLAAVKEAAGYIPFRPSPTEEGWSMVPMHQTQQREFLKANGALADFEKWAKENKISDPYSVTQDYLGAFIDGGDPNDEKYAVNPWELVGRAVETVAVSAGAGALGGALGAAISRPRLHKTGPKAGTGALKDVGFTQRNTAKAVELLSMTGSETFLANWRGGMTVAEAAKSTFSREAAYQFIGFFTTMGLSGSGDTLFVGPGGGVAAAKALIGRQIAKAHARELSAKKADPLLGVPEPNLFGLSPEEMPGETQVNPDVAELQAHQARLHGKLRETSRKFLDHEQKNPGEENPHRETYENLEYELQIAQDGLASQAPRQYREALDRPWGVKDITMWIEKRIRLLNRLQNDMTLDESQRSDLMREVTWIDNGLRTMQNASPEMAQQASMRRLGDLENSQRELELHRADLESEFNILINSPEAAKSPEAGKRLTEVVSKEMAAAESSMETSRVEAQWIRRYMMEAKDALDGRSEARRLSGERALNDAEALIDEAIGRPKDPSILDSITPRELAAPSKEQDAKQLEEALVGIEPGDLVSVNGTGGTLHQVPQSAETRAFPERGEPGVREYMGDLEVIWAGKKHPDEPAGPWNPITIIGTDPVSGLTLVAQPTNIFPKVKAAYYDAPHHRGPRTPEEAEANARSILDNRPVAHQPLGHKGKHGPLPDGMYEVSGMNVPVIGGRWGISSVKEAGALLNSYGSLSGKTKRQAEEVLLGWLDRVIGLAIEPIPVGVVLGDHVDTTWDYSTALLANSAMRLLLANGVSIAKVMERSPRPGVEEARLLADRALVEGIASLHYLDPRLLFTGSVDLPGTGGGMISALKFARAIGRYEKDVWPYEAQRAALDMFGEQSSRIHGFKNTSELGLWINRDRSSEGFGDKPHHYDRYEPEFYSEEAFINRFVHLAEMAQMRGEVTPETSAEVFEAIRNLADIEGRRWGLANRQPMPKGSELTAPPANEIQRLETQVQEIMKDRGWDPSQMWGLSPIFATGGPMSWTNAQAFFGGLQVMTTAATWVSSKAFAKQQEAFAKMDAKIAPHIDGAFLGLESRYNSFLRWAVGPRQDISKLNKDGIDLSKENLFDDNGKPIEYSQAPEWVRKAVQGWIGAGELDKPFKDLEEGASRTYAKLKVWAENEAIAFDDMPSDVQNRITVAFASANATSLREVQAIYWWLRNRGIPSGQYNDKSVPKLREMEEAWRDWHPEDGTTGQRHSRLRDMVDADGLFRLIPEEYHNRVERIRKMSSIMARAHVRDGDLRAEDVEAYAGAYLTRWYQEKLIGGEEPGLPKTEDLAAIAKGMGISVKDLEGSIALQKIQYSEELKTKTAREAEAAVRGTDVPGSLAELGSMFSSTIGLPRGLSSLEAIMNKPLALAGRVHRQLMYGGARIITQKLAREMVKSGEARDLKNVGPTFKNARKAGWEPIEDTKENRDKYGQLSGLWLRKHIIKDFEDAAMLKRGQVHEDGRYIMREIRGLVSMRNIAVTALSPGTHVTQVVGNLFIQNLMGVPTRSLIDMNLAAIGEVFSALNGQKGGLYKSAEREGMFLAEELFYQLGLDPRLMKRGGKALKSEIDKHGLRLSKNVSLDKTAIDDFYKTYKRSGLNVAINEVVMTMLSGVPTFWHKGRRIALNGAGLRAMYMIEDRISKLSAFKYKTEIEGFKPKEAAEEIGWFYDYAKVPKAIRKSRPYFAFATFPWLAAAGVAKTARKYPTRIANQFAFWHFTVPALSRMLWAADNPDDEDYSAYSIARDRVNYISPASSWAGRTTRHREMMYLGRDERDQGLWFNAYKYNPFHAGPEKVMQVGEMVAGMIGKPQGGLTPKGTWALSEINPMFHRWGEIGTGKSFDAGDPDNNWELAGLGRQLEHGLLTVGLPPHLYAMYNKIFHQTGPLARGEFKDDRTKLENRISRDPSGLAKLVPGDFESRQHLRLWGGIATTDDSNNTAYTSARFWADELTSKKLVPERERLARVGLEIIRETGLSPRNVLTHPKMLEALVASDAELPAWNAAHPRSVALEIWDVTGKAHRRLETEIANLVKNEVNSAIKKDEMSDGVYALTTKQMYMQALKPFKWWQGSFLGGP